MARLSRDPLLAAAHVILALGVALFIFVAAMMLIGLGGVLTVGRARVLAELAAAGAPTGAYWAIVVAILLIGVLMLVALRFVIELSGIVKSVDRGDPFEPQNADRLSRMGWLTVAGYGIGIVLGAIATWIEKAVGEAAQIEASFDLGGGGILLILTLFILARVFRHGAAMREDLEGTV